MQEYFMILQKIWQIFMSVRFDIPYSGNTFTITLYSIFLFTGITVIALKVLFSFFS